MLFDEKNVILQKKGMIHSVAVYCASSTQIDACYFEAARQLGLILAKNDIVCYNGGGGIGLMGAVSDAVINNGGKAVGVITKFMCDMGWHHEKLSDLIVVETMHQRKKMMLDSADAVIALPGGIGTMEEFFEVLTWKQLGLFDKPIVLLNTNGFYDDILAYLHKTVLQQFMRSQHLNMWETVDAPEQILPAVLNAEKWDTTYRKIAAV